MTSVVVAAADGDRVLRGVAKAVRACTRCRLHEGRIHGVPGEGPAEARIVLVGEAPGREEDASGRPFVGSAGRILEAAMQVAGLSRRTVFITNVVKCRPPGNRTPRADEVRTCWPYLMAQLEAIRPTVIVTLGSTAFRALLGVSMELKAARSRRWHRGDTVVFPTYHPAAVLYNRKLEKELRRDLRRAARSAGKRRRRGPRRSRRAVDFP